jgi:hypothetical protein
MKVQLHQAMSKFKLYAPFFTKGGGLKVLNNLKLQITAIEMGLVHLRSINL